MKISMQWSSKYLDRHYCVVISKSLSLPLTFDATVTNNVIFYVIVIVTATITVTNVTPNLYHTTVTANSVTLISSLAHLLSLQQMCVVTVITIP